MPEKKLSSRLPTHENLIPNKRQCIQILQSHTLPYILYQKGTCYEGKTVDSVSKNQVDKFLNR